MHDHDESSLNRPARPRPRWFRRALLGALGVVAITLALGVYLVRTPPAHWRDYERFKAAHTSAQIEQIAAGVEASLHAMLESDLPRNLRTAGRTAAIAPTAATDENAEPIDPAMVRVDEVRTITLTRQEWTALVMARHDQWLESRGMVKPTELSDVMVNLEDGELVASFKYETRRFSQIFSARFKLYFEPDGMAVIRLRSFAAGRMPVPSGGIAEHIHRKAGEMDRAGEWLAKLDGYRFKPVLDDLPHRRRATVLGYRTDAQGVALTVRVQDHRTYQGV